MSLSAESLAMSCSMFVFIFLFSAVVVFFGEQDTNVLCGEN